MEAYILLGSNEGHREQAIGKAIDLISSVLGKPKRFSHIYASGSWGFSGHDFLNQLVIYDTDEQPLSLLHQLQGIERAIGRERLPSAGYSNRIIDIDLLYLGSIVLESPRLTLPHPRLHLRRFTLIPLVELAPEMIHPQTGKSHLQLLSELKDDSPVWLHPKHNTVP